jgi:DDE superfamily endonuclease
LAIASLAYTVSVACVDYQRRFLNIVVGYPGSCADGRIFNESNLRRSLSEHLRGEPYPLTTGWNADRDEPVVESIPQFILADSGFANTRHVVTTFEIRQVRSDPVVRNLNRRLSALRYHVECAFGLLKGRFRVLQRPSDLAVHDVRRAIVLFSSLFALHNFALAHGDNVDEQDQHAMAAAFRESQRGREDEEEEPGTTVQGQRADERRGRKESLVFQARQC